MQVGIFLVLCTVSGFHLDILAVVLGDSWSCLYFFILTSSRSGCNMQLTFVGCGSSDNLIFRACMVLFLSARFVSCLWGFHWHWLVLIEEVKGAFWTGLSGAFRCGKGISRPQGQKALPGLSVCCGRIHLLMSLVR